jgi:hypothetical protein
MAELTNELGYSGTKDSPTFEVDATTATAIGTNLAGEVNKVYAISADRTVGYGSSGDPVFGVVVKVEKYKANSSTLVTTLKLTGMAEGVITTSTTASLPVVGKVACVDGAGALIVGATSAAVDVLSRARAYSVDATNHTAIIQL